MSKQPFEIKLVKEKSMYLYANMYEALSKNEWVKGRNNCIAYKTRISNPEGIYQAQKIYELIIRDEDKSQIIKDVDAYRIAHKDTSSSSSAITTLDFFKAYFPEERIVTRDCDNISSTIFIRDTEKEGFPGHGAGYYNDKEYRIRFAFAKDFTKLSLSPKEVVMAQAKKDKLATARMAELVVKDHILGILKSNGIASHITQRHDKDGTPIPSLYLDSKVDFNNLVNVAIEHYLNHIVKDLKCVIHLTKYKRNHTRDAYESLFNLSEMEFPTLAIKNK